MSFRTFSNREQSIEIGVSVRNQDVFIIQSGSDSVNDHLMELLIMVNACKTASARRITAVLPYFAYSKQSKKKNMRGAITAKLVANMLAVSGVDHVITVDLHSSQIQGFFNKPVDNLFAEPSIAKFIRECVPDYMNGVVVTKNAGGAKRVTSLADRLKIDFALIHKETAADPANVSSHHSIPASRLFALRKSTEAHESLSAASSMDSLISRGEDHSVSIKYPVEPLNGVSHIEGKLTLVGDVKGKIAFILDDMIDGTKSYLKAAEHLIKCEAKAVYLIATHGIFSGTALAEVEACTAVTGIVVTNTYPIPAWKMNQTKKLQIIDLSGALAEAIRRTHNGESISYLFDTAIA